MSASQLVVLVFALFVAVLSLSSVVAIIRSPHMRAKPLWIIGSLFGFIGLGMSWTSSSDLFLLFGVTVPVVMIFKVLPAGPVIVKTGFPFVAAVALAKARSKAG
jgi:hypothetical protein